MLALTFEMLILRAVKAQLPREANIGFPGGDHVPPGLPVAARRANLAGMEELLRSNDPVYLSFVRHLLGEEGIVFLQLDEHMSALEGSIGALPRRILVAREDLARARLTLGNATLTGK